MRYQEPTRYQIKTSFILSGRTGDLQLVDVGYAGLFKAAFRELAGSTLSSKAESSPQGFKPSASQRRVMLTQWIGEAWERTCRCHASGVARTFRHLGITLPLDGSGDHELRLEHHPHYVLQR